MADGASQGSAPDSRIGIFGVHLAVFGSRERVWMRELGARSPTTPVFRQKSAGVIEKRGVKSLGSAKECVSV